MSLLTSFFDVIVVSCPDKNSANACVDGTLHEVVKLLNDLLVVSAVPSPVGTKTNDQVVEEEENKEEFLTTQGKEVVVGATYDPYGQKCGSGGGTIAAYEYAFQIYSKAHHRTTTSNNHQNDLLSLLRVLIIHAGGDSSRCPTQMTLGKAWTSLPVYSNDPSHTTTTNSITSPACRIVQLIHQLFVNSPIPKGSVVVTAGDSLITLSSSSLELETTRFQQQLQQLDHQQVVLGLAVPAPMSIATNHGVFFFRNDSYCNNSESILIASPTHFLQKPSIQEMYKHCSSMIDNTKQNNGNQNPQVWIDTGIVIFLPRAAHVLQSLGGLLMSTPNTTSIPLLHYCTRLGLRNQYYASQQNTAVTAADVNNDEDDEDEDEEERICSFYRTNLTANNNNPPIDLYSHMMLALSTMSTTDDGNFKNTQKENYMSLFSSSSSNTNWLFSQLYDILSSVSLKVIQCPQGQFCHLGTTRELLHLFTTSTNNHGCQFVQRVDSFLPHNVSCATTSTSINVLITTSSSSSVTIGSNCVLEHCHIDSSSQNLIIGDSCLMSGLRCGFSSLLHNTKALTIAPGMMIQQTPLKRKKQTPPFDTKESNRDEFVIMILHVDDPIKSAHQIYGIKISKFLSLSGLTEYDLWPSDEVSKEQRNLWNARIHPVSSSPVIEFDSIIGWISELMLLEQNRDSTNVLIDPQNYYYVPSGIKMWKSMKRMSLQQIRNSSDALSEYNFRNELSNQIHCAFENQLLEICNNLKERSVSHYVDVSPFVESFFVNGDITSFRQLYLKLGERMIQPSTYPQYDILARTFMILSGILSDLAENVSRNTSYVTTSLNNISDFPNSSTIETNIQRIVNQIRSVSYQSHCEDDIDAKNVFVTCKNLHLSVYEYLLDPFVFQNKVWHLSSNKATIENDILFVAYILKKSSSFLEMGASSLTEVCITSFSNISFEKVRDPTPIDKWVIASAPGRIDIAGGWSDTPPICYEHGGSVVGVSVTVDGLRPLSARCRRCRGVDGGIILVSEARQLEDGSLLSQFKSHVVTLQDLLDYRDPNGTVSLLKASLLCLGVIPLSALQKDEKLLAQPIQPYLNRFFGLEEEESCGVELVSTSLLPRGSGMGGSSLLGGCILAALCRCAGVKIIIHARANKDGHGSIDSIDTIKDEEALIYSVLILEQLMTTGGGWQDQANLIGGFKIGRSKAGDKIPVELNMERLRFRATNELNERLVLVYSGTARLAKNLLQNVLRRWSKRSKEIVDNMTNLVRGAEDAAITIMSSSDDTSIEELGRLMLEYREQKKIMIGDDSNLSSGTAAEPTHVRQLIHSLQSVHAISGAVLLGAGGGGYLVLVAAKGLKGMELKEIAEEQHQQQQTDGILERFSWHSCCVSESGLRVTVVDECYEMNDFSLDWQRIE